MDGITSDKIILDIEDDLLNGEAEFPIAKPAPEKTTWGWKKPKLEMEKFHVAGYPIISSLVNWDDIGIGPVRELGYIPGKPVHLILDKDNWIISGARTDSPILYFLAFGAGGILVFLQDIATHIESNVGTYLILAFVLIPIIINLVIRTKPLLLKPYEVEYLGYDRENSILVISVITNPGGVIALQLDMPSDKAVRKSETDALVKGLRQAHTGFTFIDGLARVHQSKIKQRILWGFAWAIIIGILVFLMKTSYS
ncbi:MAG: hypothetical protein ABIC40_01885 [bacterium]